MLILISNIGVLGVVTNMYIRDPSVSVPYTGSKLLFLKMVRKQK